MSDYSASMEASVLIDYELIDVIEREQDKCESGQNCKYTFEELQAFAREAKRRGLKYTIRSCALLEENMKQEDCNE
jgi:predicted peroxiredoxin